MRAPVGLKVVVWSPVTALSRLTETWGLETRAGPTRQRVGRAP
jgi:hypothetical protein